MFCENKATSLGHLRQPIVDSGGSFATLSPLTRDCILPPCRMASEQACNTSTLQEAISSFTPSLISLSQDSNCLNNLETDRLRDVAGASRPIQMVEFNEPDVTDWKVDINGIHSKTKFEYCKSVPQFKKTIFGLLMILVLTAWGANLSVTCDVLPTINGVTHKILMQTTEVANCGVLTGPIAVQRTKMCGTLHSMSSLNCSAEDDNSILNTSGSMSHTSSYLITSNPGVDNEGYTPCNSREAIQGEEQLYYPTEAAPTRHHVLAPVADIIAASDDPMIDHCTSRMSSTLKGLNQVGKIRIQPLMTRRGERKRASLKACLVYLTAVSKKYFWVLRSKGTRLTI